MPTVHAGGVKGLVVSMRTNRHSVNRKRSDVAVPSRFRNRPSPVRVAIYRVWEKSSELGFTRATTRVLQSIIAAGVSAQSPFALVFAKKATLARMAECSEVTVYRAMKQLEEGGWILREKQERLDDGILDISNVRISEKLAVLLGFINGNCKEQITTDGNSNEHTFADANSPETTKPDCLNDQNGDGTELKITAKESSPSAQVSEQLKDGLKDGPIYKGEQSDYQKASVNHQSTRRAFVQMDGRSVAQELVWLITENRLSYGQLFKLQRLAKQVPGQELSDYVSYRSERLKQLTTTNDCYRYIKKFIDEGIDARFLCQQRAKQQHRASRANQRKRVEDVVVSWARGVDGRMFESLKTGKSYIVHAKSGMLEIVSKGKPTNVTLKIDRRFMRAVQSGDLVVCRTSMMTPTIDLKPRRIQRTEAEMTLAESAIANFKNILKSSKNHVFTRA